MKKKILQISTANFANSEINSQVPPVSLKAELTVARSGFILMISFIATI